MTSYEAIFTDEQEVSAIMGSSDERVRYIIHDAALRRQISGALRDKRRRHLAPVGLPRRWQPQLVRNVAGYYLDTPGAFCRIADWIDAGCEVWCGPLHALPEQTMYELVGHAEVDNPVYAKVMYQLANGHVIGLSFHYAIFDKII